MLTTVVKGQNVPKTFLPTSATPQSIPVAYTNTQINYIRTWEPDMPTSDTAVVKSSSRTPAEVKQSTDYYDGLGRPIQTVIKGISPTGKDQVSMHYYDTYGREIISYLPYVPKAGNTNDGKFKTDPFNGQNAFYQDTVLNPGAAGESIYYIRREYEASPLNRELKEYGAGNNWALEGGNRPVQTDYQFNTISDSVRLFTLADNVIIPSSSAFYKAGTLYKDVITNENGRKVITFKDKEGRKILEKVQSAFVTGNGHMGWLCTYYVYNNRSQLAFVLSPRAIDAIKGSWTISTTIASELCFLYRYDNRGRVIISKNPGADSVEMVYDRRDRLVFSRNGLLKSRFQCQGYYYDSINRQVQYNVCYDTASAKSIQIVLDTITTITQSRPLPFIPNEWIFPMLYTYHDKYGFTGSSTYSTTDQNNTRSGSNPYSESNPGAASSMIKGLITGKRSFVISDTLWLATTTFYNDKGRVIQVNADNWARGKDIINTNYDFAGKILSTYQRHTNPKSNVTPSTTLLTMFHYDAAGRLDSLKKMVNDNTTLQRTLAVTAYDELGQKKNDRLNAGNSSQIETLNYLYNLRGWTKAINKSYLNTAGSSNNWFGMELSYDNGFDSAQYTGNITGIKWKGPGDRVARAFGYTFDPADRILSAYFTQQNSGSSSWTNNLINYSVSGIAYDANGNINSMKQVGMNGVIMQTIDSLKYGYFTTSNRLSYVTDKVNNPSSILGDFKETTNTETQDYWYDPNGNICKDKNKKIDTIYYNDLNLPAIINVNGRGTVYLVYDGEGNKVGKVTIDTSGGAKVKKTYYCNGFEYLNVNNTYDTLQYINTENGRIRPVYRSNIPVQWSFDYFLKDHLGNTRVVLGTKSDTSVYAATMESAASGVENALFSNIDNTRSVKPTGYPTDNSTSPNDYVAKLNAVNGQKIGPSLVLRVMAGDSITISVKALYKNAGANTSAVTSSSMVTSILSSFTGSGSTDGVHSGSGAGSPINNFTASIYDNLKNKDTGQNLTLKPKAYLTYATFDDQFNLVDENSGVRQVQGIVDSLSPLVVNKTAIKKTGFIYIYLSNESGQDVYFDNLIVMHNTGPLLEETHYYPFGLTMAGISNHALKGLLYPENKKKYNGIEFNDDLDLDQYDANYRTLDPQIGRWKEIDPKPNSSISPYSAMGNNPILNSDPLGDTIIFSSSTSKEFQQAFAAAALHLITNGQGKELAQLFFSKKQYIVKEFDGTNSEFKGNFTYDKEGNITGGNGGEILWNPNNGKETETGETISPTVVLNHEFDHGAKFDKDPVGFAKDATTADVKYGNKEERRVITGSEQRTAKGLKEIGPKQVTRRSHEFKNQLLVNDPRSNKGSVISPYYNLAPIKVTAPKKKN